MKLQMRMLSALLALCLLLGTLPVAANAGEINRTITFVIEKDSRTSAPESLFSAEEWNVLMYTNMERASAGLEPLTAFAGIQQACDIRAEELVRSFSHTRPDGTECFTALSEVGVDHNAAGENIATGFPYAADVVGAWMSSSGHRGNILGDFKHMGVGYGNAANTWVQMFVSSIYEEYTECYVMTPGAWNQAPRASIEELGMYAVLQNNVYGECYLPIIAEYCTGYDPNKTEAQLVEVAFLGFSGMLVIGEYTGLLEYGGELYYVSGNKINSNYNGLTTYNGVWYYVRNGVVDRTFTGLVKHTNGYWYYIKNGSINWGYTGLVKHTNGYWYYIKNGRLDWSYTGLVKHSNGVWFYVRNGSISWGYTGLVKHTNGVWFYVQEGRINWNYTGLVPHNGVLYYVNKGQINWSYNGTCVYNGVTYTVVNGRAK